MKSGATGNGLGIDAGGTQTRWALAGSSGEIIASGQVAGLTALQMGSAVGREHIQHTIAAISRDLPPGHRPTRVCAGLTGFSEGGDDLRVLIATALGLERTAVTLRNDIEITYLNLFAPGEGYVVYAGTGSIAAFIDSTGTLHRAGGHGVLLDDAGGGFWIAIEALRYIWRCEDIEPGSWRDSPMAVEMFQHIGGSDWALTRQYVYQRERGDIGKLALAVATAADKDVVAKKILRRAGTELARLAQVMILRFGVRPIILAGRVVQLHPVIEESLRDSLPQGTHLQVRNSEAHLAAAQIAARSADHQGDSYPTDLPK